MNWERVGVFMGYVEKTSSQFLLWAPDLKRIIKSHAVRFVKNEKEESVNLNLSKQTLNVLPDRRLVG